MTQNAPIGNLAICTCPLGLCDQIKVLNSPLRKSEKNPDNYNWQAMCLLPVPPSNFMENIHP